MIQRRLSSMLTTSSLLILLFAVYVRIVFADRQDFWVDDRVLQFGKTASVPADETFCDPVHNRVISDTVLPGDGRIRGAAVLNFDANGHIILGAFEAEYFTRLLNQDAGLNFVVTIRDVIRDPLNLEIAYVIYERQDASFVYVSNAAIARVNTATGAVEALIDRGFSLSFITGAFHDGQLFVSATVFTGIWRTRIYRLEDSLGSFQLSSDYAEFVNDVHVIISAGGPGLFVAEWPNSLWRVYPDNLSASPVLVMYLPSSVSFTRVPLFVDPASQEAVVGLQGGIAHISLRFLSVFTFVPFSEGFCSGVQFFALSANGLQLIVGCDEARLLVGDRLCVEDDYYQYTFHPVSISGLPQGVNNFLSGCLFVNDIWPSGALIAATQNGWIQLRQTSADSFEVVTTAFFDPSEADAAVNLHPLALDEINQVGFFETADGRLVSVDLDLLEILQWGRSRTTPATLPLNRFRAQLGFYDGPTQTLFELTSSPDELILRRINATTLQVIENIHIANNFVGIRSPVPLWLFADDTYVYVYGRVVWNDSFKSFVFSRVVKATGQIEDTVINSPDPFILQDIAAEHVVIRISDTDVYELYPTAAPIRDSFGFTIVRRRFADWSIVSTVVQNLAVNPDTSSIYYWAAPAFFSDIAENRAYVVLDTRFGLVVPIDTTTDTILAPTTVNPAAGAVFVSDGLALPHAFPDTVFNPIFRYAYDANLNRLLLTSWHTFDPNAAPGADIWDVLVDEPGDLAVVHHEIATRGLEVLLDQLHENLYVVGQEEGGIATITKVHLQGTDPTPGVGPTVSGATEVMISSLLYVAVLLVTVALFF